MHEELSRGMRTSLRKRTKRLTSHRPPARPPHTRAAGNFHTINSWPDDEEEQRQQHSYRDRSNIDAVLPVAPQIAAADCVGKKDEAKTRRRTERPNDTALSRSLASVPHARREALYRTQRARRRRPGRIQFWAPRSHRRRQRTELSSFSAQIDRAVHAARRLDAAASGTWVLGGLKRWPAGPSTTRTASFKTNGTTREVLKLQAAFAWCESLALVSYRTLARRACFSFLGARAAHPSAFAQRTTTKVRH